MAVYVISKNGERLMPTMRYGRVRRLLKSKQAHITGRKPFTIQLNYETANYVQELELCVDAGAQHIGVSLKSDAAEYESIQFDLCLTKKKSTTTSGDTAVQGGTASAIVRPASTTDVGKKNGLHQASRTKRTGILISSELL